MTEAIFSLAVSAVLLAGSLWIRKYEKQTNHPKDKRWFSFVLLLASILMFAKDFIILVKTMMQ